MKKSKFNLHLIFLVIFILIFQNLYAQDRPKLVVGVIVDQMRSDHIYKYYDRFSDGGFKRLMNEGFNCRNNQYHYALTVTAAGHASVFTGSAPSVHGIVGNDWFDSGKNRRVYCVEDSTVYTIGSSNISVGKMSPKNLMVNTISDQLKIATNFESKVVGVALKDRGAILPAGHSANSAYWFDTATGNWVTSSYYMQELPKWVESYNNKKRPKELLSTGWETLNPIDSYVKGTTDDQLYEIKITKEKKSTFPYDFNENPIPYNLIPYTPFGNTLTKEIAIEAIKNESLGQGFTTDFLTISFSTPDYVGHFFGPNSIEHEDIYLRLDRDFEELLNFLDLTIGKENYLFFLTADHGVMDTPEYWKNNKIPAGRIPYMEMSENVNKAVSKEFNNQKVIKGFENFQYYLDDNLIKAAGIDKNEVFKLIRKTLLTFDSVHEVINLREMYKSPLNDYFNYLYRNVFHPKRSGEIMIVPEPGYMAGPIAANHGSPYSNDTHVPLIFYGWNIKKGQTFRKTWVADTTPTVSALLNILEPNGSFGNIIEELFK